MPDDSGPKHGRHAIGRRKLNTAWVALALVNLAAIAVWPHSDTIPFHVVSVGFALLYGLRILPAAPELWGLGIVIITTFTGIGLDLLHDSRSVEEIADTPLLAAMFVATVWHADRRITADRERYSIGERNARLLAAQRRFLQDASHHLRTPITIALTYAELLARDLSGREELRDIQMVIGEMTRLRRLSERLLVIAGAEDPDFLRTGPVMLDEFAMDTVERWRPTAQRRWKLGRLDDATVPADLERLGLAVDALLENAVRNTLVDDVIEVSVISAVAGEARLVVGDTGSGIGADELAHVFERFRTGSNVSGIRGTGLGLALVRAVATAHGGSVTVRSTRGVGSEFEIRLPVAASLPDAP